MTGTLIDVDSPGIRMRFPCYFSTKWYFNAKSFSEFVVAAGLLSIYDSNTLNVGQLNFAPEPV